jgi:serine/threonine protein kinase/Tol biopolymer transport system component
MKESPWSILSEWHNAWLAADPDERQRLRDRLGRDHPALQEKADALAASSTGLDGFLARPALVVAAPLLAEAYATLKPGTTVGPYQIVELIARGGMGDVYRASDVRLGRDVAVKVMTQIGTPEGVPYAADADSRSVHRFIQEARVTASLDHPNIVKVFDVGMFEGKPFLVAELLDGETLGARIKRGALPAQDAAQITGQVAAGLTVAHEAGLVHRDLKPDNIFLTKSGITKILDFGIAKLAYEGVGTEGGRTLSGVLLGTAGYLAPEQVRGDVVDARADLFALGAIAFEMVTGTRAFAGDHTIDTLHAIVHAPPPRPEVLGDAPPQFASIVIRLLQKNPDDRFQSAALLRAALDDPTQSPPRPAARRRWSWRRSRSTARFAIAAVVAGVLVAVGILIGSRDGVETATEIPLTRFEWTLPAGMTLDSPPVVSPDGRRIAFVALDDGGSRVMVRGLDELSANAIPGTEGAKQPFWSPAGNAIGFFARGKLMKVGLTGGAPIELADAPDGRGGTWNTDGTIVFGPDLIERPLLQVSDRGGMVQPVTQIDFARRDNAHRWPLFLPDGIRFLYFGRSETAARRGVYVGRLDRLESTGDPLLRSQSEALYVPADSSAQNGHLLYVADGRLEARPFDANRLIVSGDTKILATPVAGNTPYYAAMFSASRDVLAFVQSPVSYGFPLGSVARNGESLRILETRGIQGWPRLSPDGLWLAWQRIDGVEGNPDTWAMHLERGTRVRITNSPKSDMLAIWSSDGRQMAYVTDTRGTPTVAIAAADGTGVVRTMPCPGVACETNDWSSDGNELILTVHVPGGTDVWTMPADGKAPARALLADTFVEHDARLSPDRQWIAYVSNETGRPEVSVRRRTGDRRRVVISSGGGTQPVWRRDGAELFFVDPSGRLSAVPVGRTAAGDITFGVPVVLSGVPLIGAGHWNTQYDVSADGSRVYFMDRQEPRRPAAINVVLGWRALLR